MIHQLDLLGVATAPTHNHQHSLPLFYPEQVHLITIRRPPLNVTGNTDAFVEDLGSLRFRIGRPAIIYAEDVVVLMDEDEVRSLRTKRGMANLSSNGTL